MVNLFEWNRSSNERERAGLISDDEADALIDVRNMCLSARAAAEVCAADADDTNAQHAYMSARRQCIAAAEKISDRFYRDTALHFIYGLCKRANDDATAKLIFDQIVTYEIRGSILDGRPALFD